MVYLNLKGVDLLLATLQKITIKDIGNSCKIFLFSFKYSSTWIIIRLFRFVVNVIKTIFVWKSRKKNYHQF